MNIVKKVLLSFLLITFTTSSLFGTVYTAVASGAWSSPTTWGGTTPGDTISAGDQVIIPNGFNVNLDTDVWITSSASLIDVSGTLNTSSGKSIYINQGSLTGTGTVNIHKIAVASNGALAFTGMFQVQEMQLEGSSFTMAGQGSIANNLTISNGDLAVQNTAALNIENNATIQLNNASLLNNGGTLNGMGTVNLYYTGNSNNTGLETSLGNTGDVTINLNNSNEMIALSSDLAVSSTLQIDKGVLAIGDNEVSIKGDAIFTSNGNLDVTDQSTLSIATSSSLSSKIAFTGNSDTLDNLTIDIGTDHEAGFEDDVHVKGHLNLMSGTMSIVNQSIAAYGMLTGNANAMIASNMNSNLWVMASGDVSGDLQFEDTAQALNDLVIDLGSSNEVSLKSALTIDGTLDLKNGNLAINNEDLMLTANANVAGASKDQFIQTEGSGHVSMEVTSGGGIVEFPIGNSANGFAKAGITANNSASNGTYKVRVQSDVLAQGTAGTDLSATEKLVDNTWIVDTEVSGNVDVDISFTWESGAEVNGFDNQNAFVSHFDSGSWDTIAATSATSNANGTFTLSRSNINTLSPLAVFGESSSSGTIYTAATSGDWSADATWVGNSPGPKVEAGDQVVIPVDKDVNLDIDVQVNDPASSVEVVGTLSSNTYKGMTVSSGTLTGTGTINIGSAMLEANSTLVFTGNLAVNNLFTEGQSLTVAALGTVQDTLSISDGALAVQAGAGLTLENGATVKLTNGNLGNTGISIASGGAVNLHYSGTTDTTSGELMLSTINDVMVDLDNASNELMLTSNLIVEGVLNVNNGILNLNDNGMSLRTDLMLSSNGYLKATDNSSMSLKTNASLSSAVNFIGGADTLNGLTIEVGSGNEAEFDSDITVNGTFNLKTGTMNIQGQTLAVNGNLNAQTDGELSTDNQTNLWLTSSGNVSGAINFNTSNNAVGNVVVDLGSSDSVSFGSDVIVDGTLQLDNGNIAIGANDLMLTANADVQGGSKYSYVQTTASGTLGIDITAGNSSDFFVGTAEYYGKATIDVNSGSNDGNFYVSVFNDVYANGTTGVDISDTADVTDQTWDITTDANGSIDVNVTLNWEADAEGNNFDKSEVYISHYTNGSWDATATAQANFNPDTTYSISRNNIQELSPFTVYSGSSSQATTYTAVASGNWSAGSTWDVGTSPGALLDAGDEVIIPTGMSVTLDTDVTINDNNSSLAMAGELQSSGQSGITIAQGSLSGTGMIDVHNLTLHGSGSMVFAGDLTVNNFTTDGSGIAVSALTTVEDTLWVKNGNINMQTGSVFDFSSDATIILDDGRLYSTNGTINSSGSTNIIYKGSSLNTTGELNVTTKESVIVDLSSSSEEVILQSDLAVEGVLDIRTGTVSIGNQSLTINGDYMASANAYIKVTDQSNLAIQSSSSLSSAIRLSGGNTLNDLTIDMDADAEAEFDSKVEVAGNLDLLSGTMNISGHRLTLSGTANGETNGQLATNNSTNLWLETTGSTNGSLNFSDTANTVRIVTVDLANNTDSVTIGSELNVDGTLLLDNGKVAIGDNNLMITANGDVQGGGKSSYVQTSGSGSLGINLAAGESSDYHVGTAEGYAMASIELNSGSSDGNYMVNVQNDVWAQGSSGTDISASESVVDHTWDITTDASGSVDANLALTWESAAEVNSFDNQNCYISHYTDGTWDANATASATANANGTFTITRDNIASLSPFAVFDENTSVGIDDEITAQDYIEMYPNPAKHSLHIESSLKDATVIQIYSINGQLMKTVELTQGHNEIDLQELNNGTYYLHISGKEAGLSFIKQ